MEKIDKASYIQACHKLLFQNETEIKQDFSDLSLVVQKLKQVAEKVKNDKPEPSILKNVLEIKTLENTTEESKPSECKIEHFPGETSLAYTQRFEHAIPKMKQGFEAIREKIRNQIAAKCKALPGISVNGVTMGESKSQILASYRRDFYLEIEQYLKQQHLQYFGKEYDSTNLIGEKEKARLSYNLESLQQVGIMFATELAIPVKIPECCTSGPISLLTVAKLKTLGLSISQWFVTYYMFYRYVNDLDAINGSSEDEQEKVHQDCLDLIQKPHEPPFKMGTITKLKKLLDMYKVAARFACSPKKDSMFTSPKKRTPLGKSGKDTPRKSPRKTTPKTKATKKKSVDSDTEMSESEDLLLSSSSDSEEEPMTRRIKIN